MFNTDPRALIMHPLLTGIAVVRGIVLISTGFINTVSHVTEKINSLSTQIIALRSNSKKMLDYVKGVERCNYCNNMYRRKGNLAKHEYMYGLLDSLYN